MANTLKPKRTYTTSNIPSGLSAGELAVNAADGKVWIGNAAGDGNVLIASLSLADMTGSTTNITEGNKLFYTDARARLSVSAGTGINYNNSTGVITNSAPDQTVVLTAGSGISVSGTYPNFTITNTSSSSSPGGSSGEFQYKNASGGFSGTSALQFQATAAEDIRVYGTSTSRVPFSIYVPSGTGFNYFEINNVNSINYVTIDNVGNLNLFQGNLNTYNNVVFTNSNTNRTITLARPSTFAASFTLTLPTSAGSANQQLMTNGAGTLFWGSYTTSLSGGNSTTLLGSIPYQSDVNTTTLLSPNTTTTRKFLRQTGTGTNGAAPAWDTLTSSDITTALGYTPASGSGSTAAAANLYLANNFGGF